MRSLISFIHDKLYLIIMLLIAGGFVTLLAELLWTDHTRGIQMVAVYAGIAGIVLGLAAIFLKGGARLAVAGLFLALSITGLIGVWEHNEARSGEEEAFQRPAATGFLPVSNQLQESNENNESSESGESGEAGERGEFPGGPGGPRPEDQAPPLAPLGLSGLALIGAVVAGGYYDAGVEKKTS
jgi:hypothetical protein